MSLKGFLCVCYATVALAAGQKTWAQETPDAVQGTLVACLSGQASTADGKDALIALGWQPVETQDGVIAFDLNGQTLGLYPLDKLAEDIGVDVTRLGHGALTLGYNTRSPEEVHAVII